MIPTNWKTTLAGIVAALTVIVKVINGLLDGKGLVLDAEDYAVLAASVGLFSAKDKNVTGGTTRQ